MFCVALLHILPIHHFPCLVLSHLFSSFILYAVCTNATLATFIIYNNMNMGKMATYSYIKCYIWLYSIYIIMQSYTHREKEWRREIQFERLKAKTGNVAQCIHCIGENGPLTCPVHSVIHSTNHFAACPSHSLGFPVSQFSLSSFKLSNVNNCNFCCKYHDTDSDVMMVFHFVHINLCRFVCSMQRKWWNAFWMDLALVVWRCNYDFHFTLPSSLPFRFQATFKIA